MDSKITRNRPGFRIVCYILCVIAAGAILIYGFTGENPPKRGVVFGAEVFGRYVEFHGGNFGFGSGTEMHFKISVENVSKFDLREVKVYGEWSGVSEVCEVGELKIGQTAECEITIRHKRGEIPRVEYWAEGEIA